MTLEHTNLGEAALRLLFDGSPHPYLILLPDANFTIAAVNDRYLAATGTHRPDIVGRGLFEVFPDNPDDPGTTSVSDLRVSLDRVRRERVPDIMGVQKYDIPAPDGGFLVKYWSPINTPIFDDNGDVAFILHHAEDVTEFILTQQRASAVERVEEHASRMEAEVLRRANEVKEANRQIKAAMEALESREAELARLNDRLKELDKAKTEFFANISHEFRTPLTLLLGPLEDLLARQGLGADIRAALDLAHGNAQRLLKLVNALLDFARIEAGRARASFAPTDLAAITADLASNFRSACDRAGLGLVVQCPPLPQPVHVDRDMWEKIVLNLLSNAFKFTLAGQIGVRVEAAGDHARVIVHDTGSGIPAAELPRLFERFHRIESIKGRSHEGTGIGLALVHELVTLHGGTIAVDSAEGRGSAFTISLPFGSDHLPRQDVTDDRPDAAASTAIRADSYVKEALRWLPDAVEPPAIDASAGAQGRILVADDNQDMRAYVSGLLRAAGYLVEPVADGRAALSACRDNPPDLVLSDVMMPELDGFGLLAALRADQNLALVPVVLLSARAGEEARIEGLAAGADDYLVKPFAARELVARVEGAIRLARARADAARREHDLMAAINAELARSNQELDEFAYIVSHDLKEPLRGIHNYITFLKEDHGDRLDDEGLGYLDRMLRLAERQSTLIDRLLAYSRVGTKPLPLADVDVEAVLDDVAEDLKPSLAAQGVELRITGPLPRVTGNALRLGEVFQNLIANGAKYNDKASKWVEVGCDTSGPVPVFHVRDNGIGIPEQHRDTVFRIFKRLHEQNKFGGGTGAGLTIVKKIIERHGGHIWLDSIPGEGTTFLFTLTGAP